MSFGAHPLEVGGILFLGGFAVIVGCVLGVLATAIVRARSDLAQDRVEKIRWSMEFAAIPAEGRRCRHALSGLAEGRICQNGFDCGDCGFHVAVLQAAGEFRGWDQAEPPSVLSGDVGSQGSESLVYGFWMPPERLYHRGHAWVLPLDDGTAMVGLDEFGAWLVGPPDRVVLPRHGSRLRVNGPGWRMIKGGEEVRILSPIDGTVLATGGASEGWYLRLRTGAPDVFTHLLRGTEVRPWLLREIERLQGILSRGTLEASIADGGAPLNNMLQVYADAHWPTVWAEIFFEP